MKQSSSLIIAALIAGFALISPVRGVGGPDSGVRAVTMHVSGLKASVEVMRDRWGIPHIYARNTHDLFFTQGYLAAQTRMWQIELWRRNAEGKLAEVLGSAYVERDKFARMLKVRGDWDAELRHYHPEGPIIFEAFAAGVNAAIREALAHDRVPIEFAQSGFRPEPVWTAESVVSRVVSAAVNRGASFELFHALTVRRLGLEKAQSVWSVDPPKRLSVPDGLDLEDIVPQMLDVMRDLNSFRWKVPFADTASAAQTLTPPSHLESGSNNWVVSGRKSLTGRPLLASDPHRALDNPSMRYWVHLVAPGWNVIGMADAGQPGVGIGHNEHIGWGWSNLSADTQDLYVEETAPDATDRYHYKGDWLPVAVYPEEIRVKGQPTVRLDVKMTRHGPVIYEDPARRKAYALRMPAFEVGDAGFFLGSFGVMQSRNWQQFVRGSAKWSAPMSIVYADTRGNIGFMAVGRVPIRPNWDGTFPVPGKDGRYEWAGYIPAEQLPRSSNDPRGFYASANNNVLAGLSLSGDPAQFGHAFSPSYRFDRIVEVLSLPKKFGIADMRRLQADVVSLPARELIPLLRRVSSRNTEIQWAIRALLAWNLSLDASSGEATIYEYWRLRLTALVYALKIPQVHLAEWRNHDLRRVIAWLRAPDEDFGPDPIAGRDAILVTALEQALELIKQRAGADKSKWAWGNLHQAPFAHPLLRPETKSLFSVPRIPRGGDEFTVQASSAPTQNSADQTSGASIMMVLDMADWDRSVGLNAPGNEGNVGSPHYRDLTEPWGAGEYFPLAYSREKVLEVTRAKVVLRPAETVPEPRFTPVQPESFADPGALSNAWADFDNDGDPDLAVSFAGGGIRLYRNDKGRFRNVGLDVGLPSQGAEIRSLAWGDYDGDGDVDLYAAAAGPGGSVGRPGDEPARSSLFRNDGARSFSEVAEALGVGFPGPNSRQASWVDYDNDGDLDLFVAQRSSVNRLYRQERGRFTDVSGVTRLNDPRRTVGACWFDMDEDGDIDLFIANQQGDKDAFYRNDSGLFSDIAAQLGMHQPQRPLDVGGVTCTVGDYDNDGDLDLFVATYGVSLLYRNEGGGVFQERAQDTGIAGSRRAVGASWGDYDNDGWLDLYSATYRFENQVVSSHGILYRNEGGRFADILASASLLRASDHGVQWIDFDSDGDLDLSLTEGYGQTGRHSLFRNELPGDRRQRSLQVAVLDSKGRATRVGAEVRLRDTDGALLGTRQVTTGDGYGSQSVGPVHFGLVSMAPVTVEVTFMTRTGRRTKRLGPIDPMDWVGKTLQVHEDGTDED